MSDLAQIVQTYSDALEQLCDVFADPSTLSLGAVRGDVEKLEAASRKKAFVDAAFAHLCVRENAGRLVGGTWANDYLEKELGLSAAEAHRRISRAKDLFGPKPPPPEEGASPPLFPEEAGESKDNGEPARKKARKDSQEVSAEKQAIIDRELKQLTTHAAHERPGIFSRAMKEAKTRSPEDLRLTVRRMVDRANRKHKPLDNPNAGFDKRGIHVSPAGPDGTRKMTVTLTEGHYAQIKALIDANSGPGSNVDADSSEDTRLPAQRKFDQLWRILTQYEHGRQAKNRGAASIVVSITLDDLANADWTTKFPTNTGVELTCFDLVRLGLGGTADFVLQIDRATGVPLSLGRTRLASVEQRIVALAVQGVCAWAGCTVPTSETEMHHIVSWLRGGTTDTPNLTALCRRHHRWNNDARDGSCGRSHVDRDPETGRVGVVAPDGGIEFNETSGFHTSAWSRLRDQGRIMRPGHPPDPLVFPAEAAPP
ncbi:HNH endonuclease signature motif containing protein [Corynebacterium capitovis]|uniref:HNH endonuclease signature motif containing protein n=1 Tax=Corynebacterium capitovis TaxID=131081 RepID=UPI0003822C4E|nr:HNH endonuclease signature motif containing protein [Corynebacterium capitovis]